ncbi:MAG: alanine racemase [Gemmatimonadetes bacterium]|nr:alanine racemase [Gemmatimonadota bacterium]
MSSNVPQTIHDVETPVPLVDVARMQANIERTAAYCRDHGIGWRPHVKTHKTPELAAIQLSAGAIGLTVATRREAEVMAIVATDILLAYPPIGESKVQRLVELPERVRLSVALDSREALHALANAARRQGREVNVLVEIDAGLRRVGVSDPERAVELAREACALDGVAYRGILFYPGHIRAPAPEQGTELRALAALVDRFLERLGAEGLPAEVVSGGSTPTLSRSHEIPGLTEIRPGTCIFNDRSTAAIGASRWQDCAYSILATVVSTAVPGRAIIDAGSKALSKEEVRGSGTGYGALLEHPEVVVQGLYEEHGILDLAGTPWRPQVGDRVRVVPNHVCVSVNLNERLYAVEGERITGWWSVAARGREPFRG